MSSNKIHQPKLHTGSASPGIRITTSSRASIHRHFDPNTLNLIPHLHIGIVKSPRLEVFRDGPPCNHRMTIQLGSNSDVIRPLEWLPGVTNQHPTCPPVVLHWLPVIATGHSNGHACQIPRSSLVLDGDGEPVSGRPRVHLEGDVLPGVLTRHPLVQDVVQSDVPKLPIPPGQSHTSNGSPTQVEGGLVGAAVGSPGALICDHNSSGLGPAAWVSAFHIVALATSLSTLVDRIVGSSHFGCVRCACELSVTTCATCTSPKQHRNQM